MELAALPAPVSSKDATRPLIPSKRKCSVGDQDLTMLEKIPKSNTSLESLPTVILDCIFQYVSSADLLNLCWLSKSLYWPAALRIYRSIYTISKSNYTFQRDDLHKLYGNHWEINYGTAVFETTCEQLIYTLRKNENLASFVHRLAVDFSGYPLEDIYSLVPNLRISYDGWSSYPHDIVHQLEIVQCPVESPPTFTDCLVELTLDSDHVDEAPPYRVTARNLIASNGHCKLRKLRFAIPSYDFIVQSSGSNLSEEIRNSWLCFMDEFRLAGVQLHLHSLEVNMVTSKPPAESAELVSRAVDLKNLQTLILNCHDRHPENRHVSFVEEITKYTSSLKSLAVDAGPIDGLCRALVNNLLHKLEELHILMSDDVEVMSGYGEDELDRRIVQEAILSSQSSLRKLKIFDKCSFRTFNESVQKTIHYLRCSVSSDHYFYISAYQEVSLVPRDIHWRPFITAPVARDVEASKEIIHHCLKTDLVYSNAALNLPNLTQYYIGGFYVDVKQGGIFVNERTILFDPDKAGIFSVPSR